MKRVIYSVIACGLVLMTASCAKEKHGQKPAFRVLNFSPGCPPVYMTLDDWQNTGDPISYEQFGTSGEYPYDNKGSQKLKVYIAESKTTLLDTSISMQDLHNYAIFAANLPVDMDVLVAPVNSDYAPSYNQCKIRFVHLSPDMGPVKVVQNFDTLYKDVNYLTATGYIAIDAGKKTTRIYSANNELLYTDNGAEYKGVEIKNIVLSGFLHPADSTMNAKITVVKD